MHARVSVALSLLLTVAALALCLPSGLMAEVARAGGGFDRGMGAIQTPRTNIGSGDINRGDFNVPGSDWGWGGRGAWGAGAAYPYAGGVYPDGMAYSVPSDCSYGVVNGTTYQSCNGENYTPVFQGSTVGFQIIPAQ